jgi:hypothetical protein
MEHIDDLGLLRQLFLKFKRVMDCVPTFTGTEVCSDREVDVYVDDETETLLDDVEQRLIDTGYVDAREYL